MTKNRDEKYRLYSLSVQNPEHETNIISETYKRINGRLPRALREDFCGTFLNSVNWVKENKQHTAIALDIDAEPLGYGIRNNLPKLTPDEQKRLFIKSGNVLTTKTDKIDVICALNFSYFCFQDRQVLLKYFRQCRSNLKTKGILMVDCFGGPGNYEPQKEMVTHRQHGFKYIWELKSHDLVNNRSQYAIHFKPNRKALMRNAFTYDWRMWSIPEIKETMLEAGFKRVEVLLEGTSRDGTGNGKFRPTEASTEECETWVAYIIGITK